MSAKWIGRSLFVVACALLFSSYYYYFSYAYEGSEPFPRYIAPIIGLVSGLLVLMLDMLYREKIAKNFFAVFIGLVVGVFFSEQVIRFLERFLLLYRDNPIAEYGEELQRPMIPIIYLIICYMSVMVTMHAKQSLKFIIPFVSLKDESRSSGGMMLDSSVLIDGRIVDLCRSMIIDSKLYIPDFVINELQTIADSSNKLKRLRGRRGLDVVKKLQELKEVDIEVLKQEVPGPGGVDEKLVRLAGFRKGKVVTNDFNLIKVAKIHEVEAINLNEIANAMKLSVMVGEPLEVEIIREGEGETQGVGYLPDGTMVVVEGASDLVGERVTATITNIYHRDAGRIVFARVNGDD
ncbi:MAG: TRAM domain-containing protein [Planctomycetota bacterium]|nr:TRAM domain-containing protein [Planctomycetota bacterium]